MSFPEVLWVLSIIIQTVVAEEPVGQDMFGFEPMKAHLRDKTTISVLSNIQELFGFQAFQSIEKSYYKLRLSPMIEQHNVTMEMPSPLSMKLSGQLAHPNTYSGLSNVTFETIFNIQRGGYFSIATGMSFTHSTLTTPKMMRQTQEPDASAFHQLVRQVSNGWIAPALAYLVAKTNAPMGMTMLQRFQHPRFRRHPFPDSPARVRFRDDPLRDHADHVHVGTSVLGEFELLSSCAVNASICHLLHHAGIFRENDVLVLEYATSRTFVTDATLTATLPDVALIPHRLVLTGCTFFISNDFVPQTLPLEFSDWNPFQPSVVVGVRATLEIGHLKFQGSVYSSVLDSSIGAQFGLVQAKWERAFGIDALTFEHVSLITKWSFPLVDGRMVVRIPAVILTMDMRLGPNIQGLAFALMDLNRPLSSSFYAEITSPLTIATLWKAVHPSPPAKITQSCDSGFICTLVHSGLYPIPGQDNIYLSYAPFLLMDLAVPYFPYPVIMPKGIHVRAQMDLFGKKVMMNVTIDPLDLNVRCDIQLSPIRLANGVFQIYRSPERTDLGPHLLLDTSLNHPDDDDRAQFQFEGYVQLFHNIKHTRVFLSDSGVIQFKRQVEWWGIWMTHNLIDVHIKHHSVALRGYFHLTSLAHFIDLVTDDIFHFWSTTTGTRRSSVIETGFHHLVHFNILSITYDFQSLRVPRRLDVEHVPVRIHCTWTGPITHHSHDLRLDVTIHPLHPREFAQQLIHQFQDYTSNLMFHHPHHQAHA